MNKSLDESLFMLGGFDSRPREGMHHGTFYELHQGGGPGVDKDAPRKTGVGRFFELVGRDMNGMFLANLLACLGFAPVICLVYIGFLMNSPAW